LRVNETEKAVEVLQNIVNSPDNYYNSQAKELFLKLESRS
jgi:hypothetical protein